jgi:hypothetical protein
MKRDERLQRRSSYAVRIEETGGTILHLDTMVHRWRVLPVKRDCESEPQPETAMSVDSTNKCVCRAFGGTPEGGTHLRFGII